MERLGDLLGGLLKGQLALALGGSDEADGLAGIVLKGEELDAARVIACNGELQTRAGTLVDGMGDGLEIRLDGDTVIRGALVKAGLEPLLHEGVGDHLASLYIVAGDPEDRVADGLEFGAIGVLETGADGGDNGQADATLGGLLLLEHTIGLDHALDVGIGAGGEVGVGRGVSGHDAHAAGLGQRIAGGGRKGFLTRTAFPGGPDRVGTTLGGDGLTQRIARVRGVLRQQDDRIVSVANGLGGDDTGTGQAGVQLAFRKGRKISGDLLVRLLIRRGSLIGDRDLQKRSERLASLKLGHTAGLVPLAILDGRSALGHDPHAGGGVAAGAGLKRDVVQQLPGLGLGIDGPRRSDATHRGHSRKQETNRIPHDISFVFLSQTPSRDARDGFMNILRRTAQCVARHGEEYGLTIPARPSAHVHATQAHPPRQRQRR